MWSLVLAVAPVGVGPELTNGGRTEWHEVRALRSDLPPWWGSSPSSDVHHQNTTQRCPTPLHLDLAAILPGDAEAEGVQKRVLQAYQDESGLSPHWNDHLRKMVDGHLKTERCCIRGTIPGEV